MGNSFAHIVFSKKCLPLSLSRGLNIDTIAAILVTIALGLSVDYSAHIGHAFMVATGTRQERVYHTLVDIGPAVLNGGFSTFLAFGMLMTSQSIIFRTFFKIFFLVVFFGLFHGLASSFSCTKCHSTFLEAICQALLFHKNK